MKFDYREKIKEAVLFYLYLFPFKIKNNLFPKKREVISIFSNPRGGSTWLAELMRTLPKSSVVWEPMFIYNKYKINFLNPFAYPEIHKLGFGWNQPIPEDANWPEAKAFFEKLFSQQIVNLKLYRFNDIKQVPKSETFIYKFCFGNLALPWLSKNFDIKPIYLVRHPCAVVASQLKYGWNTIKKDPKFVIPNIRYKEVFLQYEDVFKQIKTPEENLAAVWAITNLIPIKNPRNDIDWVTIAYEDLLLNPQKSINKIFDRYKMEIPHKLSDKIYNPSFTSKEKAISPQAQIAKWQKVLTKEQIKNILKIVKLFGVDFYGDDLEPDYKKIYKQ